MERAQTHIVDSAFAERDKFRYYIDNVGGIENLLYGELVYHTDIEFKNTKKREYAGGYRRTTAIIFQKKRILKIIGFYISLF